MPVRSRQMTDQPTESRIRTIIRYILDQEVRRLGLADDSLQSQIDDNEAAIDAIPDLFVFQETMTGAINGVNDTFTLAATPVSGSVSIYKNGLRMQSGAGNDYTISGDTITFVTAQIPATGDSLFADYIQG